MKKRLLTGLAILASLVLVIFARQTSKYVFDAFIVLLSMIAGYEMSNLLAKKGMYNNKYSIVAYPIFAYALFLISLSFEINAYLIIVFQIALFVVFTCAISLYGMFTPKSTKNEIETRKLKLSIEKFSIYKAIHSMFACIYPCFLLLFLCAINNIDSFVYIILNSVKYLSSISLFAIILVFVIPVFTDTFAYLTGTIIKGPKLCPKISPNKTISGAIGGIIWGTCSAILLFIIFDSIPEYNEVFTYLNFKVWYFAIVGFIASIMCEIGDIFESYLKRLSNVKDTGTILPGHGGIMDRTDSHMFCAPIIFIFLIIVL